MKRTNLRNYNKIERYDVTIIGAGIAGLIAGTFLATFHNIWVKSWPIIITLLGWVAIIEGVLFIAFPKPMLKAGKKISKNEKVWGIFALIFGLLMGYFGFVA